MKNYYAILEVPVGSDVREIREAYRRLVQENLWNKETFADLKEAYEILTTPTRRAEYDKSTFGEVFPMADPTFTPTLMNATLMNPTGGDDGAAWGATRHCPMGAASQCPVINARVPLTDTYCPECGFLLAAMPTDGFEAVGPVDLTQQPRLEESTGRLHRLKTGANSVGREGADVLLPDRTISRRHAQVDLTEDGQVTVTDQGSTNGTQVNGESLAPQTARPVRDGDLLRFGSVSLYLRLPGQEGAAAPVERTLLPGQEPGPEPVPMEARPAVGRLASIRNGIEGEVLLVAGVTTFGRRPENTVVITGDPYVSGSHAQIIAEEGRFLLTDVGSTNGTVLNGERLTANQPVTLAEGDEILLGSTTYTFEPLPLEEPPLTLVDTEPLDTEATPALRDPE